MPATSTRAPRSPLVPPDGIDAQVRDMTATFAADVTLAAAQAALAEHHQWLPIDGDQTRPLGELVASNSTGPLRLGYGAWRDLLLGVQFTAASGAFITAGGRTMKNVAGYDLTKLMVGQREQLGRIVTVTTRTYRRPSGAIVAEFAPDLALAADLLPTPLKPHWMLLSSDSLSLGYLGDETSLAFYRGQLAELKPRAITDRPLDADIADRAARFRGDVRVSVPPARVLVFVTVAKLRDWIADPAFGIVVTSASDHSNEVTSAAVRPAWSFDEFAALRTAAKSVGGSVVHPAEPIASPVLRRLLDAFEGAIA